MLVISVLSGCGAYPSSHSELLSIVRDPKRAIAGTSRSVGKRPFEIPYIELSNEIYSPTSRHITIFVDESYFTERQLSALITGISEQNPTPEYLTVVAKTSWKEIEADAKSPWGGMSGSSQKLKDFDHKSALFSRSKKAEFFTYIPDLNVKKDKIVRLTRRGG